MGGQKYEYEAVKTQLGDWVVALKDETVAIFTGTSAEQAAANYAAAMNVDPAADEVYQTNDEILASLRLPNPCPIKVVVAKETVAVFIGQRDHSWSRQSGDHVGSGVLLPGVPVNTPLVPTT